MPDGTPYLSVLEILTIGLDGVDAMVPFYAKGGFEQATRHRRFRYQGSDIPSMADHHHVSLQDVPENDLARYDRQCFPAERLRFVRQWSQQNSATSLASYHDGNLQGFGVIRRCTSGWRVGPLFADNVAVANDLCDSLLVGTKGLSVFIDVPDANQEGIHWVQQRGMEEVFGCERMYYGKAPEIDYSKIFGVHIRDWLTCLQSAVGIAAESRNDVVDYFSVYIREAEVSTSIAVG